MRRAARSEVEPVDVYCTTDDVDGDLGWWIACVDLQGQPAYDALGRTPAEAFCRLATELAELLHGAEASTSVDAAVVALPLLDVVRLAWAAKAFRHLDDRDDGDVLVESCAKRLDELGGFDALNDTVERTIGRLHADEILDAMTKAGWTPATT